MNTHPWNTGLYYLPLLNVRSKACFQHLISSVNNSLNLNVVGYNYICPWECCFFPDSHLQMDVKYELEQHRWSSNGSCMGNSQAKVPPVHPQARANDTTGVWDATLRKGGLLCYGKRGKYSQCAQTKTYTHCTCTIWADSERTLPSDAQTVPTCTLCLCVSKERFQQYVLAHADHSLIHQNVYRTANKSSMIYTKRLLTFWLLIVL